MAAAATERRHNFGYFRPFFLLVERTEYGHGCRFVFAVRGRAAAARWRRRFHAADGVIFTAAIFATKTVGRRRRFAYVFQLFQRSRPLYFNGVLRRWHDFRGRSYGAFEQSWKNRKQLSEGCASICII